MVAYAECRQSGTFLPPQLLMETTSAPYGIAVGDMTGNSVPDLVFTSQLAGVKGATLLVQNAGQRGNFLPPDTLALPGDATAVTIGDLNGDGRNDIVLLDLLHYGVLLVEVPLSVPPDPETEKAVVDSVLSGESLDRAFTSQVRLDETDFKLGTVAAISPVLILRSSDILGSGVNSGALACLPGWHSKGGKFGSF